LKKHFKTTTLNLMASLNVEENYAWEIKYDEEDKPYYYNRFSERTLLSRPSCFESGGRVNIKQPVIEAQFKGLWYKGILLGPADRFRFSVQLEDGPVPQFYADRSRIRKWTKLKSNTVQLQRSSRGSLDSMTDDYDLKESFLEIDHNMSLSKLSDTFTANSSTDEKYSTETYQEAERNFKPSVNVGNKKMLLQSRVRPKSLEFARKQGLDKNDWNDEESDADWMETMLPLRANPHGEVVGRKQRANAVLLDLQDLRAINNSLNNQF